MPDAIGYSIMSGNKTTTTSTPLRQLRKNAMARDGGDGGGDNNKPSSLRQRTYSAPACIGSSTKKNTGRKRHRLLIEDHYPVDPHDKKLVPGHSVTDDDDWDRDVHDFFNLISLVPVVVLNIINWNWDMLLDLRSKHHTIQEAWTGEWFPLFYAVTTGYFVADLIWISLIPRCVKSPGVIIQHHIATLLYLIIPYRNPGEGWLMGACLSVEANTWLLIARRVFHKHGFEVSVINVLSLFEVRVNLISVLFYATWFGIRCYMFPCIWKVVWTMWVTTREETGAVFYQRYAAALFLHSIFCLLNFKWTFDLCMSKWTALRIGKAAKLKKGLKQNDGRKH